MLTTVSIISVIIAYLYIRNRYLSNSNKKLKEEMLYNQRRINLQKETIDVIQNTKNDGVTGAIKLMYAKKQ
jgi:hypothetical protein